MKKPNLSKVVKFFKTHPIGKGAVSIGIGALNSNPITAPFTPSIKSHTLGLAGKGKHDFLAYAVPACMVIIVAGVVFFGLSQEQAEWLQKVIESLKSTSE